MKINPQIFADAAERVPDTEYTCHAICRACGLLTCHRPPERTFFEDLYGVGYDFGAYTFSNLASAMGEGGLDWWIALGPDGRDEFRIWALCFAHAAATYRRPKTRTAKRRFR